MKKLLLCALFCFSASVYCMEEFNKIPGKAISLETPIIGDSEEVHIENFIENEFSPADMENIKKLSLNELKRLSAVALLKKLPKKQDNQKTGMSESYLTFIREPIFSINLPYFDDDETKADRILKESLRIHYAFLKNTQKADQKKDDKKD